MKQLSRGLVILGYILQVVLLMDLIYNIVVCTLVHYIDVHINSAASSGMTSNPTPCWCMIYWIYSTVERVQKGVPVDYSKCLYLQCSKQWYDILTSLLVHDVPDIQHRGVHIVMNMVEADKEIAQRIVESNMFEVTSFYSFLVFHPNGSLAQITKSIPVMEKSQKILD